MSQYDYYHEICQKGTAWCQLPGVLHVACDVAVPPDACPAGGHHEWTEDADERGSEVFCDNCKTVARREVS